MAELFWLSDEQWAVIGPFMPTNQPGARRVDDRRVLSGIWRAMLAALAAAGWVAETAALDSTYVKAHRCAHGVKGGPRRKPSVPRVAGRRPRSTSLPTSSGARRSSTSRRATPPT